MLILRMFDGHIKSNMGKIIGVDATLTCDPKVICKVTEIVFLTYFGLP